MMGVNQRRENRRQRDNAGHEAIPGQRRRPAPRRSFDRSGFCFATGSGKAPGPQWIAHAQIRGEARRNAIGA